MKTSACTTSIREAAHDLIDLGYGVIALRPGTKIPSVPWRKWRSERVSHDQLDRWLEHESNLAIVCGPSNICVLDADSLAAEARIANYPTPMTARTPRGGLHAYYQAPKGDPLPPRTRMEGLALDLRAGSSYIVVSPSWSRDRRDSWNWQGDILPPDQLPTFDPNWFPRQIKANTGQQFIINHNPPSHRFRRAAAYLGTIEGAISGAGGHNKTLYAAAALIQKFGLTIAEAWPLFVAYNARCVPPWSERDLYRKLQEAARLRSRSEEFSRW